MRLFAALELPEHVRRGVYEWWSDASEHLDRDLWRHLPVQQWHLTLAFYGDVAGEHVDDLAESLSLCAESSPALPLISEGCGVFPKPARANVFWIGVADAADPQQLKHLARCCRRAGHATVRGSGAREAAFRGHITLARARNRFTAMRSDCPALGLAGPEIEWQAERLCLYESILRPEGAKYRRLETFDLGNQGKERGHYVR